MPSWRVIALGYHEFIVCAIWPDGGEYRMVVEMNTSLARVRVREQWEYLDPAKKAAVAELKWTAPAFFVGNRT